MKSESNSPPFFTNEDDYNLSELGETFTNFCGIYEETSKEKIFFEKILELSKFLT